MRPHPYRLAAERDDPYAQAWARLRKRRLIRRVAVGVVGYALATLFVFALKSATWRAGDMTGYWVFTIGGGFAFFLVLVPITVALARVLVPFTCPRCGQPFFQGLITELGFTKSCAHCGLAVDSPTPQSDSADDGAVTR